MKVTAKIVDEKICFDISLTNLDYSDMLCDTLAFHHKLQNQLIEQNVSMKYWYEKTPDHSIGRIIPLHNDSWSSQQSTEASPTNTKNSMCEVCGMDTNNSRFCSSKCFQYDEDLRQSMSSPP